MQNTTHEDKLRLLMILAAIYPEELEGEKGLNWMKVGLFSHCLLVISCPFGCLCM